MHMRREDWSLMMTHLWKYNNYLLYYLSDKLHFMTLSSINIKNSSMHRLRHVILDGESIFCSKCLVQLFAFNIGLVSLYFKVMWSWMQKLWGRFLFSTWIFWFVLNLGEGDISLFYGTIETPIFEILVISALGFKARVIRHLHTSSPVSNGYLRFTSGASPAALLTASIAAEPFWPMYLYIHVHASVVN